MKLQKLQQISLTYCMKNVTRKIVTCSYFYVLKMRLSSVQYNLNKCESFIIDVYEKVRKLGDMLVFQQRQMIKCYSLFI